MAFGVAGFGASALADGPRGHGKGPQASYKQGPGGKAGYHRVLDENLLAEIFDPRTEVGLPTGLFTDDGEIRYHAAAWHVPYRARSGELFWLPTMLGYGGQVIQLMPNGVTAFRFAYDDTNGDQRFDTAKLARIADAIQPF